MKNDIETVVFDLDGTVYQNTVFHRDYLHFLVEGTRYEGWHTQLVEFAEQVYAGRRLQMNCFYSLKRLACQTPEAFFCALDQCLCPPLADLEALLRQDILYLGDAWAASSAWQPKAKAKECVFYSFFLPPEFKWPLILGRGVRPILKTRKISTQFLQGP